MTERAIEANSRPFSFPGWVRGEWGLKPPQKPLITLLYCRALSHCSVMFQNLVTLPHWRDLSHCSEVFQNLVTLLVHWALLPPLQRVVTNAPRVICCPLSSSLPPLPPPFSFLPCLFPSLSSLPFLPCLAPSLPPSLTSPSSLPVLTLSFLPVLFQGLWCRSSQALEA